MLDERSRLVVAGAGLRVAELEARVRERGLTLGHFPQSFEYVSVGGCAATRSAGQASTGYGRFEELVQGVRLAAPAGDLDLAPRPASAAGPELRRLRRRLRGRPRRDHAGRAAAAHRARVRALRGLDVQLLRGGRRGAARRGAGRRRARRGAALRRGRDALEPGDGRARRRDEHRAARLPEGAPRRRRLPGDRGLGRQRGGGRARGAPPRTSACGPAAAPSSASSSAARGSARASTGPTCATTSWTTACSSRRSRRRRRGRTCTTSTARSAARCRARAARGLPRVAPLRDRARRCTSRSSTAPGPARRSSSGAPPSAPRATRSSPPAGRSPTTTPSGTDHVPWMRAEAGDTGLGALRALKAQLDPAGVMNPGKLLPA